MKPQSRQPWKLRVSQGAGGGERDRLRQVLTRIVRTVERLLCGVRGHELLYRFGPGRLSLQCLRCGAETPGWTLELDPRFVTPAAPHARVIPFARPIDKRSSGARAA